MSVVDRISATLLGVKLVSLERRLIKGWDYLEFNPDQDRPGQPSFELWMRLLGEYEAGCRTYLAKTGRWWSADERPIIEDADQGDGL